MAKPKKLTRVKAIAVQMKNSKGKTITLNLTLTQKKFCENYVSTEFLGNGVRAYSDAFGIDISSKNQYQVANVGAQRLLQHEGCLKYVNELLDEKGLNDVTVDKHLLFLIQQGADLSAKVGAIREYNKLRNRVSTQLEVTVAQKYDYSRLSDAELDTFLSLAQKAIV